MVITSGRTPEVDWSKERDRTRASKTTDMRELMARREKHSRIGVGTRTREGEVNAVGEGEPDESGEQKVEESNETSSAEKEDK